MKIFTHFPRNAFGKEDDYNASSLPVKIILKIKVEQKIL